MSKWRTSGGSLRGAARRRHDVKLAASGVQSAIDRLHDRLRTAGEDLADVDVPREAMDDLRRQFQEMIQDVRRLERREDERA